MTPCRRGRRRAVGCGRPSAGLHGPEAPRLWRSCEGDGTSGHSISKAGELEESVRTWLAQHGPALLRVNVKPMQLVTPPSRFVLPEAVAGMAVYTATAILHGKGCDVLGDARGQRPLMPSDETEIVRPVFSEDNDNV